MNDIQKETAPHQRTLEKKGRGIEQTGIPRGKQLEGVAGGERTDGPRIEAPGRCGGHPRSPQALGAQDQASVDGGGQAPGLGEERGGRCDVTERFQHLRGGSQPGHRPEVVPVVIIVGPQVFGAEPGGEQPAVKRILPLGQALALQPSPAAADRPGPLGLGPAAGELAEPLQNPQRLAVGIPFALLREKEAGGGLATWKAVEHPFDPAFQAEAEQGVEDEGGVAEPEPLVGIGAGVDLAGGMQHQRAHRRIEEALEQGLGEPGAGCSGQGLGPGRPGRLVVPEAGAVLQGDGDSHPAFAILKGEQGGRRSQPNLAVHSLVAGVAEQSGMDIAGAVVGKPQAVGRRIENNPAMVLQPPAAQSVLRLDAVDEADAFRVVGAKCHHQGGLRGALSSCFDATDRDSVFGLDPDPGAELKPVRRRPGDHRHPPGQFQMLVDLREPRGEQPPAIFGHHPAIEGPAVEEGRGQSPGIDNRQLILVRQAHRGPVAVGQVDVGDGEGPGDEGFVAGIVLAFDPVRPDPVEVVLDGAGVEQAPGVEHHPGAQQLKRLFDGQGLAETLQSRQEADRVDQAPGFRQPADDLFPGKPSQQHSESSWRLSDYP